MVVLCRILVDRPENGAYRSGDTVEGTVKYHLDRPMTFEAINVSLIGEGMASWPVSQNSDYACDKQEYLSLNKDILQDRDSVQDQGCYSSTFVFVIPENIPSTFKHTSCYITYKIFVNFTMIKPFIRSRMFEIEIPVYGTTSPCSPEPLKLELTKEIFSLGLGPNNVNIKVVADRTFVSSGESINLFLIIDNNSSVRVTAIKTELVRYFSLVIENVNIPFDIEHFKETKSRTASVNKCSVKYFSCMVPTTSDLYSVQHTRKVLIEYKVRVTVKFPFPYKNVFLEIPVVIGTGDDVKMYRKMQDCY